MELPAFPSSNPKRKVGGGKKERDLKYKLLKKKNILKNTLKLQNKHFNNLKRWRNKERKKTTTKVPNGSKSLFLVTN